METEIEPFTKGILLLVCDAHHQATCPGAQNKSNRLLQHNEMEERKRTILLVDDHPLVRKGIRDVLDEIYEVCGETENGKDGVEQSLALKPDVVILDMSMPVMNGLEAAREIRRLLPATRILMLSMHDSPQFEAEAREAGATQRSPKQVTLMN
jgi:CheY-like chemotaxis protein